MRNKKVDAYIESLYGKPDFSKTFLDEDGMWRTPLGNGSIRIWQIDDIKQLRQGDGFGKSPNAEGAVKQPIKPTKG